MRCFLTLVEYVVEVVLFIFQQYWKLYLFGPVHSKHGNLHKFSTYPGYRRYFISPIGGFWLRGIQGHYILKEGTGVCACRTAGTAGPKWEGTGGGRTEIEKRFYGGRVCASLCKGVAGRDGGHTREG